MYLRSATSKDGILPPFVQFDPPIHYPEAHFRWFERVNGLAWETAVEPKTVYPVAVDEAAKLNGYEDYEDLYAQRWSAYSGGQALPVTELLRHVARLKIEGNPTRLKAPTDLGRMPELWATDLLMWVGESYYPAPGNFISEGIEWGFNKRISANGTPPLVLPGRTKLYLAHPKCRVPGKKDPVPALFGYAYLTEAIYAMKPGDTMPKFIEELEAAGRIEAVFIGPAQEPSAEEESERDEIKLIE